VARSVLAELLRFVAANEELPRSLVRYPGHTRDTLGKLLAAAADRLEAADAEQVAAVPTGSRGLKVRKGTEVEKAAARAAEELQESMDLSKSEREQKKRERAAAADAERQATEVAAQAAARPVRTRLFTDGAARGNPGPAGADAVITSPDSTWG
jgi:ribonuclease HI